MKISAGQVSWRKTQLHLTLGRKFYKLAPFLLITQHLLGNQADTATSTKLSGLALSNIRHYYTDLAPDELLSNERCLAVITHSGTCSPSATPGHISTGLAPLPGSWSNEVFEVTSPVEHGRSDDCYWSKSEDTLCAAIWLSPQACLSIEEATTQHYLKLLNTIQNLGYAHPFRFWNYIPRINEGVGDEENYRRFCTGRLKAFEELNMPPEDFPAASALGHLTEGAVIYVLSAKSPGQHYENPRQESAYQYPKEYGPSSPSFARATGMPLQAVEQIFVSGTASIIGHKTHAQDCLKTQLEITCDNIDCLVQHSSEKFQQPETLKVYLRKPSDFENTKTYLKQRYPLSPVLYTQADVCRADLLVEIEAIYSS